MASHTEVSNIRPSKVEPLHVELPAVGDSHVETSTRPEPGLVRESLVGMKWACTAYAAVGVVTFLAVLGAGVKTNLSSRAVGFQILVSVFVMCLSVLAGVWAGKGRPAWRFPAMVVVGLSAISVVLLAVATGGDWGARMAVSRGAAIGMAVAGVAVAAAGVAFVAMRRREDDAAAVRRLGKEIVVGFVVGAVAQGLIAAGWLVAARAMG